MTNAENKQQVVDDKVVVKITAKAIHNAANPEHTYRWGGINFDKVQYDLGIEQAQAALKALTDNGYIITRG